MENEELKMEKEALRTKRVEAFEKAFEEEARNMANARELAVPPAGMKWRRKPIDELREHHELTGAWLREELERIILKRSQLPAAQRHLIVKLALSARIKMNTEAKRGKVKDES
jgi:hypothetical protein